MTDLYGDGLVLFYAKKPQPNQTAVDLVPRGVNRSWCRDVPLIPKLQAAAEAVEASWWR